MKRRAFLAVTSKLSLAMAIPYSMSKRGFAAMLPSDITSLSAVDLSQVIREKHASCVEVMQAYLSRIEKYNSVYNAIVSLQPEQDLLRQAKEADDELAAGRYRGWMHGMPHAVKDLAAVEGLRHTSGSYCTLIG